MRGQPDVLLGLGEQVERAHQVLAREPARQRGQPRALPFGQLAVAGPLRIDRDHHDVAHHPRQLAEHQLQVVPRLHGAVGERERARAVFVGHRVEQVEEQVAAHQAEHGGDVVDRHRRARERQHLVEGALRIAHAAFGGARNQPERVVGHRNLLGVGDLAQLLDDRPWWGWS